MSYVYQNFCINNITNKDVLVKLGSLKYVSSNFYNNKIMMTIILKPNDYITFDSNYPYEYVSSSLKSNTNKDDLIIEDKSVAISNLNDEFYYNLIYITPVFGPRPACSIKVLVASLAGPANPIERSDIELVNKFIEYGVPRENIWLLIEKQCSSSYLLSTINNISPNLKDNDILFMYLGGHGTINTNNNLNLKEYVFCTNTENTSSKNILDAIKSIRSRIFMIVDSCYSGQMINDIKRYNNLECNRLDVLTSTDPDLSAYTGWILCNLLLKNMFLNNNNLSNICDICSNIMKEFKTNYLEQKINYYKYETNNNLLNSSSFKSFEYEEFTYLFGKRRLSSIKTFFASLCGPSSVKFRKDKAIIKKLIEIGVQKDNIVEVLELDCTPDNIEELLKLHSNKCQDDDIFYVYLGGCGTYKINELNNSSEYFLCTWDYYLSSSKIINILKDIKCELFIVVDSAFSGQFIDDFKKIQVASIKVNILTSTGSRTTSTTGWLLCNLILDKLSNINETDIYAKDICKFVVDNLKTSTVDQKANTYYYVK